RTLPTLDKVLHFYLEPGMAWKNGCIDKLSIDYWEMPDVMAYLVERSIAEGDGGECCYTDAQPIDYAEDCAYSPSEMLECLGANWQEQGVADDGLSYALYGHPNINVENVSGSMMVVSTEQPGLSVMVDYRSGIWVVQPFAHDESFGSAIQFGERLAPVEAGLLRPNVYQHFWRRNMRLITQSRGLKMLGKALSTIVVAKRSDPFPR
ncbi:hypothetical protein ACJ8MS_09380, partial [Bifidobacterium longum subsp. longum]